ncbi:MAG TPA: hypothetical protein EYQ31_03925, partial [Candidatus Handelsmanbacteria bacterium]|nr:hypothetical protein [Candidatus Handelsmanbacteria bacterium]
MKIFRFRSWALFLFVGLLLPAPGTAEFVMAPTPHKTMTKMRKLLDAADLRVMLPLGYELAPELAATATLSRRRAVDEVRVYVSGDKR